MKNKIDSYGQSLSIGDHVVFIKKNTRCQTSGSTLFIGRIESFTSESVKLTVILPNGTEHDVVETKNMKKIIKK